MKYCVIHNLRFETPAKRDILNSNVLSEVAGRSTWGKAAIHNGTDEAGHPSHRMAIRFQNRADMDELFAFMMDKLDTIPVLKGSVSKHECRHDEGTMQPCEAAEEYTKE